MSKGEVGILNVGAGDTKLTFDKSKPEERKRAAAVVADMLKRGFAILIQVGEKDGEPLYQRAKAFDPETCEYIIVGTPEEEDEHHEKASAPPAPHKAAIPSVREKRGGRRKRVAAESTTAVAVARSAGG